MLKVLRLQNFVPSRDFTANTSFFTDGKTEDQNRTKPVMRILTGFDTLVVL